MPSRGWGRPSHCFVVSKSQTFPKTRIGAGARAKLRTSNAFLEGQFGHSGLHYSRDNLDAALGHARGGVECRTASGLELRHMARWESPERRFGIGSRSIVSGTSEVAQTF